TLKLVNGLTRTNAKDEKGQTSAAESDRREIGLPAWLQDHESRRYRGSSRGSSGQRLLLLQDQGRDWRGDRRAEAGGAVRAAAAMERSWIAQGSALRLCPRRLREQGFLGRVRLRGRDVLLRAPQGGRLGRHQSDRDLRSTPGLDREPVSGTRKGERLQGTCRAPAFRHARRFDPGSCLS